MPPSGSAYNVDWIIATGSNVSVATHRDWFINFTDFTSKLDDGTDILGVGNVHLPVRTSLDSNEEQCNNTLILNDVVLAPTSIVNIVGSPVMETDGYSLVFGGGQPGAIKKGRKTIAVFEHIKLYKLLLSGQPRGQTVLDPNSEYWINATWPNKEWERWKKYKASSRGSDTTSTKQEEENDIDANTRPYTKKEKKWLKDNFGNEFLFLRQYGYSIHKDDQRAEGRRLARGMIKEEAKNNQ